jgi:hypothetical protein
VPSVPSVPTSDQVLGIYCQDSVKDDEISIKGGDLLGQQVRKGDGMPVLGQQTEKTRKDERNHLIAQNGMGTRTQLSPDPAISAISCSVCVNQGKSRQCWGRRVGRGRK